ncbi:hypothetical protein CEXT_725871 [Caerostris extrusa]|uniref:Uncharacterized protein n=1 Tax=Caerostris extrusa TaxID=172846 RepID=A0AAV4QPW9_CAEEX|nr:hypothetical protein CEXT_725871 [Caerostris extrusa]
MALGNIPLDVGYVVKPSGDQDRWYRSTECCFQATFGVPERLHHAHFPEDTVNLIEDFPANVSSQLYGHPGDTSPAVMPPVTLRQEEADFNRETSSAAPKNR